MLDFYLLIFKEVFVECNDCDVNKLNLEESFLELK
jgi:hypothetical protein